MIRFGRSPQHTQVVKQKKADNLDILTLLDNCNQIFKDDRITLRNMVKDGNQDVIALLHHYKKQPNSQKELTTELRKYLKRKQDQKENVSEKMYTTQSPFSNRFKVQQDKIQNPSSSQKKSCPDLWKQTEFHQPKTIHLKARENNEVQLSEIILTERDETKEEKDKIATSNYNSNYNSNNPHYTSYQERVSEQNKRNISVSNSPKNQNLYQEIHNFGQQQQQQQEQLEEQQIENDKIEQTGANDPQEEESIDIEVKESSVEQYQSIDQHDYEEDKSITSNESIIQQTEVKSQIIIMADQRQKSEQQIPTEQTVQISQSKYYCFFNYVDCQQIAKPEYKNLFTHWPSLLHRLHRPDYMPLQKTQIILDCTPEYLFSILFPNSSHVKINYYAFINTLKPYFQIDLDQLFKELDQDFDDWINYRETGMLLESLCLKAEQPKNCVKVIFETIKSNPDMLNTICYQELELFLIKEGYYFAQHLFQEVDTMKQGFLTYWDLYMHREIYLMEKLCGIVQALKK